MKPFTKHNLDDIVSIANLTYSPDGKTAAFCTINPNTKKDKYDSFIYLLNPTSGRCKKLTNGGNEGSFFFSSNKAIVFPALRDEADRKAVAEGGELTVFYELPVDGGEARELFRVAVNNATAWQIKKDLYLVRGVFDLARPDTSGMTDDARAKALAEYMADKKAFELCDELPYRFDGMGYINKLRTRLYIYNARAKKLTPITGPQFMTGCLALSDDHKKVFFCGEEYEVKQMQKSTVYCYDVESKNVTKLCDTGYSVSQIALVGDRVYMVGMKRDKMDNDLFSIPQAGGALRLDMAPEQDFFCWNSTDTTKGGGKLFVAHGNELYYTMTDRKGTHLYRYAGGKPVKISDDDLHVIHFDVSKNGEILTACLKGIDMMEIYKLQDGAFKKVTHLSDATMRRYSFGTPEHMLFKNRGGVELDGWVIKPPGLDETKKHPAVLVIHGGPRGQYHGTLHCDMQTLVSEGYIVFYCNPHGSSGVSREFANLSKKYGSIDFDDFMDFTDAVLKKYPMIDDKRLGVMGASYGGYMSNWIIGHTDRFAAAVPQCSISNWITMYGCSDIPWFVIAGQGGTPWSNHEALWNTSPLKYADKVKTPTLFLQYDADYRCPMDQAVQMYTALILYGVDTRLVMFAGDSHVITQLGKPSHRMRRHAEIINWFAKYLKK